MFPWDKTLPHHKTRKEFIHSLHFGENKREKRKKRNIGGNEVRLFIIN